MAMDLFRGMDPTTPTPDAGAKTGELTAHANIQVRVRECRSFLAPVAEQSANIVPT
jgi:hypothetical protein